MSADDPDDFYERPMDPVEFERLVALAIAELDGPEGNEMRAHMAWFMRRFPTPIDRVRESARQYARAKAMQARLKAQRNRG